MINCFITSQNTLYNVDRNLASNLRICTLNKDALTSQGRGWPGSRDPWSWIGRCGFPGWSLVPNQLQLRGLWVEGFRGVLENLDKI